jgi:hypothetical protein
LHFNGSESVYAMAGTSASPNPIAATVRKSARMSAIPKIILVESMCISGSPQIKRGAHCVAKKLALHADSISQRTRGSNPTTRRQAYSRYLRDAFFRALVMLACSSHGPSSQPIAHADGSG